MVFTFLEMSKEEKKENLSHEQISVLECGKKY